VNPGGPLTRVALVAVPLALLAAGAAVDARRAFPLLRFAIERTPDKAPSAVVLPEAERGRAVSSVSLYVRPHDLHDPDTGLLPNRRRHGAAWERAGWVSFFEGGRLVHSAAAGVRIHGGSSRDDPSLPQGFRLYFRRRLGARELPGGVAFSGAHAHPLKRLILHNDERRDADGTRWHLVNSLAYDIAEAAGGITSPTRPVRFLLNGEYQGVFVLKEHFDPEDFFETHAGHRVRVEREEFDAIGTEIQALRPVRMRRVARLVDLDNLTRWFIATVFCATRDAYQGPGQFRDPARADAQWFWVHWDMDQSFRAVDQDSFAALLSRTGARRARRPSDPRPRLLTALLDEDPEYRAYFQRTWVDLMNHVLTPAFLDERYRHYSAVAAALGIEDREYLVRLRHFLTHRPVTVWRTAERWLRTGESVGCRITGTRGAVEVDGHRVGPGWEGRYFRGMTVHLQIPQELAYAFSHWLIDGRVVMGRKAAVTADAPRQVEPIWLPGASIAAAP
jgi:hypothetical protein